LPDGLLELRLDLTDIRSREHPYCHMGPLAVLVRVAVTGELVAGFAKRVAPDAALLLDAPAHRPERVALEPVHDRVQPPALRVERLLRRDVLPPERPLFAADP